VTTIVLTAIGDDRPGLVDAIAEVAASHGASWDRSHMAQLAGKFAGIVELTVPESSAAGLVEALGALGRRGVLSLTVERSDRADTAVEGAGPTWALHLVGHDRPGILHEVSQALAVLGVSIEELETDVTSAPMSAEKLFSADALIRVPTDVDPARLREVLERLANELMVDLDLFTASE
jgi:glycine cleavage system regulatory protein